MAIKRPGKEEPKKVIAAELGRLLGVNRKTIHEWRSKSTFPRPTVTGKTEKWDVLDVFYWVFVTHLRHLGEGGGNLPAAARKAELECVKLEQENERRQIKLEAERGKYVLRDAIYAEIESMFHRIRSRLEAVPDELASTVPPELRPDYLADARHKMGLVLKELESWGEE